MKSYKFNLMQDSHELEVDDSCSTIHITNAFCDSVFDDYFTAHSHIVVKFIDEKKTKSISYSTDIIYWDEGVIDRSMKIIQFNYIHNIPVGCTKIKVAILNKKAIDFKINIAIGVI
ncbi:MAG: hypothetical protein H0X46_09750 [Bacteroidetes bacterium]|nr:hypothetical protein [Bacteroidota bacterium]